MSNVHREERNVPYERQYLDPCYPLQDEVQVINIFSLFSEAVDINLTQVYKSV